MSPLPGVAFFILIIFLGLKVFESNDHKILKIVDSESVSVANQAWEGVATFEKLTAQLSACDTVKAPCKELRERIQNVADAIASCDDTTQLCVRLQGLMTRSEFLEPFKRGRKTMMLPRDPFYFALPNEVLQFYGEETGYRSEIAWLWLHQSRAVMVAVLLGVLLHWWFVANWIRRLRETDVVQRRHDHARILNLVKEDHKNWTERQLWVPRDCRLTVKFPSDNLSIETTWEEFAELTSVLLKMRDPEASLQENEGGDSHSSLASGSSRKPIVNQPESKSKQGVESSRKDDDVFI